MKNIAILTIRTQFIFSNFGSFLQHWALRKVLQDIGYSTRRVSLEADDTLIAINKKVFIIQYIKQVVCLLLHLGRIGRFRRQEYSIFAFRKFKNATLFSKDYEKHIGSKIEKPLPEEVVIVGGDQVCKPYYLETALKVKSKKYITYSASSDWTVARSSDNWNEIFKKILPHFAALGLREQNGIEFLDSLGFKADKVADPVMLIPTQELRKIGGSTSVLSSNALFCYLLNIRESVDLQLPNLELLTSNMNAELIITGVQGTEALIPAKYYISLSPCSYLRALMDAKYVVTNSFHGTVLAILLHKPFISLKQVDKKGTNQNTRQEELLNWLQLAEHRISSEELSTKGLSLLSKEIDWVDVDTKISAFREESIEWLKNNLDI